LSSAHQVIAEMAIISRLELQAFYRIDVITVNLGP